MELSKLLIGLYFVGLFIMPARRAHSFIFNSFKDFEKNLALAFFMPYTPEPKYNMFKYFSNISSLEYFFSN